MSVAHVGIGGNLEGAREAVVSAIEALDAEAAIEVTARSSLYASAPRHFVDQDDFVNAVVRLSTALKPLDLLDRLQALEDRMGRRREGPRFGPRVIDLDLLLYDDERCRHQRLELPHPRMHERRFVLQPLVEIDPDAVVPGHGRASELLVACASQRVDLIGPGEN